jgi:hypothetical protein
MVSEFIHSCGEGIATLRPGELKWVRTYGRLASSAVFALALMLFAAPSPPFRAGAYPLPR